jgi:Tol biopolymer transport system component
VKRLGFLVGLVASLVIVSASSATFRGQNGKIAYTVGGAVWLTNPDGTGQRALTGALCAENVAWSPDGRLIAFDDGDCRSPSRIYVIDPNGNHVKALTNGACADVQPAWSPSGSRIAFRRGGLTATCNNELWTMRANGRDQRQLTHDGINPNNQDPSWSPDGAKIAFSRFNPTRQIFILDLGTGVETDIDGTGGTFADTGPDWSPDGTMITFTRCCAPGNEVAVMSADGSSQTLLTSDDGNGNPESTWSPDGTKLAFIHALAPQSIYTMSPSGTAVSTLNTGSVDNHSISWQACAHKCP